MLTNSRKERWKNDGIRTGIVRCIGLLLATVSLIVLGLDLGGLRLLLAPFASMQTISSWTALVFLLLSGHLLTTLSSGSSQKPSLVGMVLLAGSAVIILQNLAHPELDLHHSLSLKQGSGTPKMPSLALGGTLLLASLVVLFGRRLVTRQPHLYDLLLLAGALGPAISVFVYVFQRADPQFASTRFDSDFVVAVGLVLYFVAASLMFRESAISRLLVYTTHGGRQFRRLVLPVILLPLVSGWFMYQAVLNNVLEPPAGIALFAGIFCLSMLVILTWNARRENYWFRELNAEHEAKLEAQFQLSLALDAAGAIIVFDAEGHIKSVNRGASRIFGWSSQQMLAMQMADIVPAKATGSSSLASDQFCLEPGNPRPNDAPQKMLGLSRDGLEIPLLVTISEHRVGDEVLYGAVMIRIDDLANQMYQLTREMNIDSLTGIENRHSFDLTLGKTQAHGLRQNQSIALLILDIDYFKRVNDTHGHAAGDAVLAEFANRCSACLRFSDRMFRYGGEEFVILADDAGKEQAHRLAERIRANIQATPITYKGESIQITCSIGIALVDRDQVDFARCLQQADQALYRAKETGRNRTVVHQNAQLVKSA